MFSADILIDSVQDANKKIVNQFVTNDSFKKELVKLIDAQTQFAKSQTKSTLALVETFYKNANETFYAKKTA